MNSVIKAFQVLDVFSLDEPELTFTEIVKLSGLGRTNTHKILKTLVFLNCLAQDQKGGSYRLGPKLFELGSQFLAQLNLRRIAMPFLVNLAEEFEDTVYLCIEDRGEALCLERIDGPSPIKVTVLQRGGRLALHAGAAPIALLSGKKDDEILKLMQKHDFEAYTENTVKNIEQLMVKVKNTRKQGFSESWEDVNHGVASFGAPVRDSTGKVIGAISVGGLIARFDGEKKNYWIAAVKEIAQNISDKLGFI